MSKTTLLIFTPNLTLSEAFPILVGASIFSRCSPLTQLLRPFLTPYKRLSRLSLKNRSRMIISQPLASPLWPKPQLFCVCAIAVASTLIPFGLHSIKQESIMSLLFSNTRNKIKVSKRDCRSQDQPSSLL